MEIREHCPGAPELEARSNEEIRLRVVCFALDGADAGGPHGDDAACAIHGGDRFRWNLQGLGMQPDFVERVHMQWLESSQTDVQRYLRDLRSRRATCVENLGREVQTRSGRGDRTPITGENSLIAFAIGG